MIDVKASANKSRGIDAGPRLVKKLIGFGDPRTSDIVARIAEEEVGHVATCVFWFISVCNKMGYLAPHLKASEGSMMWN
ncbi:hypothetical protein AQUCO_07700003v1 [Aquilegia coerulea]|uniref:Uncharacterized protein n=1 Tax=Aquilegia coerulea TaxID=218851 RepID=A0A2G5C863_AQUCA|nr:hypothetical protein AQUCO_07700003v1 [Aquilegia coerulea]